MTEQRSLTPYPSNSLRVIVVEDDFDLRIHILLPALRDQGFQVRGAANAAELYRILLHEHFDIAVLDIGLPGEDGITIATHLRSTMSMGVVMVSGRSGQQQQLLALESGADVYLTKPIDSRILVATLRNLAHRLAHAPTRSAIADKPNPQRWRLDSYNWQLISPHGEMISLTANEHSLVRALVANKGQVVPRDVLIGALTREVYEFDPHRLEMMVHRLRKKAMLFSAEKLPLITVRGKGYLLDCDTGISAESAN
jgi:two-component system, OmpR family, response regulator PhoP